MMMDGHVDHAKANNHTSVVNSPGLEGTPKSFDSFVHNCRNNNICKSSVSNIIMKG
jgi:hypothetical protein